MTEVANLRLTGTAALRANTADDLSAYPAVEPVAATEPRRTMLLIGVTCGCLLTPWWSPAVLLRRGRAAGVDLSCWPFRWWGLLTVPLVLLGTVLVVC